jgi:RHS repeat-associated protein
LRVGSAAASSARLRGIFGAAAGYFREPLAWSSRTTRKLGDAVRDTLRTGLGGLRRKPAYTSRVARGDPIDVATGDVLLRQVDVELPGLLPLVLERTHLSSHRSGRSFGMSWASTLDQRLELDGEGVCFAAADGMILSYRHSGTPGTPVFPEAGPRLALARDEGGYTVTDPAGRTLHFAGEGVPGILPLAAISDRNGNRIDLRYDADARLVEIRHTGSYRIGVEIGDVGRITALRLLSGGDEPVDLMRYDYDEAGHLAGVIDSSGRPRRFEYDAEGRLTRWVDRNGHWYRYEYDQRGRCVRGRGPDGFLDVTLTYGDRHTIVTDSLANQTNYRLNEAGQVVAEVDPLGRVTTSAWDRHDRLLSRTDPLGRTIRYSYDENGDLVAVTRPDGRRVTTTYDERGLPLLVTDVDGSVWRRTYDDRGNVLTLTDPSGATTRYSYAERGGLAAITDALGSVTRIGNDEAGLPVTVTDPLGGVGRYVRDRFGRVTKAVDPLGTVTGYSWTVAGEPASRTMPDGARERRSYDDEGNLVEYVDAAGHISRTTYGAFDLPTAWIGPDGARLEFTYDTELRLTAVTNARGLVWRYVRDQSGRVVEETDFNGRVLCSAYDAAGQLVERTNGAGQTTHYTYDSLGNATEQRCDGAVTTFAYDINGRLVRAVNDDADLRLERDSLGRIAAEVCDGRRLVREHDALGRLVARRTPSGAEARWRYDAASRPVALETAGRTLRFAHDPAGREIRRHLDGAILTQEWDPRGRLSRQRLQAADRTLQERTYSYRPDGGVVGIADRTIGDRRLDLDVAGRVTAVHADGWAERYAYDPAGRLADASWPAAGDAAGGRAYDGTLVRSAGRIRYDYDAQGRTVLRQEDGLTWRYDWDADDRLVGLTTPGGERWRYRYDALGRRIAKQRLGPDGRTAIERTDFTWDDAVLAEQTHVGAGTLDARTTTWDYEPGGWRPLAQTDDAGFYGVVTDLTGSPAEMVGPGGDLAWRHGSTLWGTGRPRGEATCPLRFPGQYHDEESGLHYNLQRYYDPGTGRYQSPDPLGLGPQPDHHAYVHNPVTSTDVLGLMSCTPAEGAGDPGLAIVYWERKVGRGHASIRVVSADWQRQRHTELLGAPGHGTSPVDVMRDYPARPIKAYAVDLPHVDKAFDFQYRTLDTSRGAFSFPGNNCVTYCADVIRAGGVHDVPDTIGEVGKWLIRNGRPVERDMTW